MACVVDEELVVVEGDEVGEIVELEPCPAELDELDGDDPVVLDGVDATVLEGVAGVEFSSVVVVGCFVSVPNVVGSVEGANELLGSLPLHLET